MSIVSFDKEEARYHEPTFYGKVEILRGNCAARNFSKYL